MHKLFAHNLNTETNLDVFFLKYLGAEVLEKLNNSIVNCRIPDDRKAV